MMNLKEHLSHFLAVFSNQNESKYFPSRIESIFPGIFHINTHLKHVDFFLLTTTINKIFLYFGLMFWKYWHIKRRHITSKILTTLHQTTLYEVGNDNIFFQMCIRPYWNLSSILCSAWSKTIGNSNSNSTLTNHILTRTCKNPE